MTEFVTVKPEDGYKSVTVGVHQGMAVRLLEHNNVSETSFTARVFAAAILLYPLVAVFSPKAMVLLLGLPVLAFLFVKGNREAVFGALPPVVSLLLAGLAAWSLVTVWWAPAPLDSLQLWFRVVVIGLCGMVMFAAAAKLVAVDRHLLTSAFVASGWFFVVLFGFELFTAGSLSRLAVSVWNQLTPWGSEPREPYLLLLQSSAALTVFVWPCMLAISRRHSMRTAVLFAIAVAALLLAQNMEASLVAYTTGIAVFWVVCKSRRWGVAGFLAGLFLVNLAVTQYAFEFVSSEQRDGVTLFLSDSTKERLHVIDFVYEQIAEHPIIGWGLDASRAIGQDTLSGFGEDKMIPLHPHNLWAQSWLELGIIGLVLTIALVAAVFMRLATGALGRVAVSSAAAAMAGYLLIGNISYGMWQNWWLAMAWLSAGFLAVMMTSEDAEDP